MTFAIYLLTTGLKGTSSLKLHRDIGVTQKNRMVYDAPTSHGAYGEAARIYRPGGS